MKRKCQIQISKTKKIFLLFAICHLPFCICHSQNASIKGKVDKSYLAELAPPENNIYAFTYDDYITFTEKELAFTPIDEKGNFNFNFSLTTPTYIFLTIENAKAEMVVEPGKNYEVEILPKDTNAVHTLSAYVSVEMNFKNSDSTELNFLIADFFSRYEAFLEDHQKLFLVKSKSLFGKIDTMKILSRKKYFRYNNSYLNNYITYTFASLEESITLDDRKKNFSEYLEGKPIRFLNYEYMNFFNQFFSTTINNFLSQSKVLSEINLKTSFSSLKDILKASQFLQNDTIREMVALKLLSETYRFPQYKPRRVQALVEQASNQCITETNRKTANNLLRRLTKMKTGTKAPDFFLSDISGKIFSPDDFSGKYVYINFWASWCSSCIQEMMLIPELKKIYGAKISFVSISVDKKMSDMKNFLAKNPKLNPEKVGAGWTFLYCNNYRKMKEDYNVLTVPTYYLLDPKGNILKSPADKPQDMEPTFIQITKKKPKK